jgi:hypothetical protein
MLDISEVTFLTPFYHPVIHEGDLGGKFDNPLREELFAPNFSSGFFSQGHLEKINEIITQTFNGTRQIFLNKKAAIDKKMVVFGNSFFEKTPSWGLSPFFAGLFKEYHFIWSPNLDMEYCARVSADIVIAQTCERFLTRLPDDILQSRGAIRSGGN